MRQELKIGCSLECLESRCNMLYSSEINNIKINTILNDKNDCPELLRRIGFTVTSLRSRRCFLSQTIVFDTENSPISRSMNLPTKLLNLMYFLSMISVKILPLSFFSNFSILNCYIYFFVLFSRIVLYWVSLLSITSTNLNEIDR